MTITVNKEFIQKSLKKSKSSNQINKKDFFNDFFKDRHDYNPENIVWKSNNEVEIKGGSTLAIHSFLLKAEELGLDVEFEKSTKIKII